MNIRKVSLNNGGFKGAEVHFLQEEEKNDEWDQYVTHYEEEDDYDDVPASMLDEHHKKFAKLNMPTHWMKMPTHP